MVAFELYNFFYSSRTSGTNNMLVSIQPRGQSLQNQTKP